MDAKALLRAGGWTIAHFPDHRLRILPIRIAPDAQRAPGISAPVTPLAGGAGDQPADRPNGRDASILMGSTSPYPETPASDERSAKRSAN